MAEQVQLPVDSPAEPPPPVLSGPRRLWDWKTGLPIVVIFSVFFVLVSVLQVLILVQANGSIEALAGDPLDLVIPFSFNLVTFIGFAIGGLGAVLAVGMLMRGYTLAELGFRRAPWLWLGIALILVLPLFAVRVAIGGVMLLLDPSLAEASELLGQVLGNSPDLFIAFISLLLTSFLVPLWEETFFRGFVHNWLRNRLSFWPATLISAALFGIFHLNLVQGFAAFLLGLVLAWLYEKADSLWAPITLHVTNNLIAQGLFFLMLLLQDYLPGM